MQAGALRDRVTFYSPSKSTDGLRGQAVAYTTVVATIWAQWRGLTARETLQAQALQTLPTYRLRMRYRSDITPLLRVRRGAERERSRATRNEQGASDGRPDRRGAAKDLADLAPLGILRDRRIDSYQPITKRYLDES
jgi:SPP1 family predicted phage head-tail adaptor